MKTRILLFIFIISNLFINAQSSPFGTQIIYGEEIDSKKSVVNDFIGEDDDNYYFFMYKKGKPHLDKYNKKLELAKSTEIILKRDEFNLIIEKTVFTEGNIVIFYSHFDKKTDTKSLYYELFTAHTMLSNGKVNKVAEITDLKRSSRANFSIILSPEESKILVYMDLPYEKDAPERYSFMVFDNQMIKQWEKDVTLPYADKYFTITGYKVDQEGNAYILGKYYDGEKGKGYLKYDYHLLVYNEKEKRESDYIIKLESNIITDFTFVTNEKELICAGFYSEVGLESIKGLFFLKLDSESSEVISQNKKEFSFDFITEGMSESLEKHTKKRNEKEKDVGLYGYYIEDLILNEDGSCSLLSERYYEYETTHTTTVNGHTSTQTTYHYHYYDVLVANIKPDGEINWTKKLFKIQKSTNDGGKFLSYVSFVQDEYIYVIYNENSKNREISDPRMYKTYVPSQKYTDIAISRINSEGYIDKKILVKAEEAECMIRPKLSLQINENELILFSMKKKTYQFVKVVFNSL